MIDRFKFRAYNKVIKKMFDVRMTDFSGGYIWGYDLEIGKEMETAHDIEHCIIMQCTGLKDKNGKLIYEGDIIRPDKNPCKNPQYYFTNYKVEYFKHKYILRNEFGSKLSCGILWNKCINWLIIGNIYENTELLKDEK